MAYSNHFLMSIRQSRNIDILDRVNRTSLVGGKLARDSDLLKQPSPRPHLRQPRAGTTT